MAGDKHQGQQSGPESSETGHSSAYHPSIVPPLDIVDIVVEFTDNEWRSGIPVAEAVDAVVRKASLHFRSIGYQGLDIGTLRGELFAQLSSLVAGRTLDPQGIKEDVVAALKSYYDEERKRVTVRWRSRIGLAADGITLISFAQTLGGFTLGVLEQKLTARNSTRASPGIQFVCPWPVTGLKWDWLGDRGRIIAAIFRVFLSADIDRSGSDVKFRLKYKSDQEVEKPGIGGALFESLTPVKVFLFDQETDLASLKMPFRATLIVTGTIGKSRRVDWEQSLELPLGYDKNSKPQEIWQPWSLFRRGRI